MRRFITVFTRPRHLSLSWARRIHYINYKLDALIIIYSYNTILLYMFRASSAHLQEDTVVYKQHMVPSLSMRVLVDCRYAARVRTQKNIKPEESSLRVQPTSLGTILILSPHLHPWLQTEILPSGVAPPKPSMRFSYLPRLLRASGSEPEAFKYHFLIWTSSLLIKLHRLRPCKRPSLLGTL